MFSEFLNNIILDVRAWGDKIVPVKINLFFKVADGINCEVLSGMIEDFGFYEIIRVQPVLIAQSPTDGSVFQAAVTGIELVEGVEISYKSFQKSAYTRVTSGEQKWIYFGASSCFEDDDISKSSEKAFYQISSVLKNEGMSFFNILRQWNYIPDIVGFDKREGKKLQHYQEFNEARGKWYFDGGLIRDFPAATGIGTSGQLVRLEIIAADTGEGFKVFSLQNPDQSDAHRYSREKLVGTVRETTPLFERGKMIVGDKNAYVWVSGTAAIKGEESLSGDTMEQTRITCENISLLTEKSNLINAGLAFDHFEISPVYCRAYVKHLNDGVEVRDYLSGYFPEAEIHVLQADVCRGELLVEIEAEFFVGEIGK